jgi:hypothetical protein
MLFPNGTELRKRSSQPLLCGPEDWLSRRIWQPVPSRRHALHNGVQKQLPRPRCFQEASSSNSWRQPCMCESPSLSPGLTTAGAGDCRESREAAFLYVTPRVSPTFTSTINKTF